MKLLRKNSTTVGIALAFAAAHSSGIAADAVSLEAGTGNRTEVARLGMQWAWQTRWYESNGTHFGGFWDATLAQWRGSRSHDMPGARQHLTSIGITPVLRYQNDDLKGIYAEAGIGAHRLSERYDNNGRSLSTTFQFGSHIGAGYVFRNNWELGLSFQHFSNAGIRQPNDGLNLTVIRLRYRD